MVKLHAGLCFLVLLFGCDIDVPATTQQTPAEARDSISPAEKSLRIMAAGVANAPGANEPDYAVRSALLKDAVERLDRDGYEAVASKPLLLQATLANSGEHDDRDLVALHMWAPQFVPRLVRFYEYEAAPETGAPARQVGEAAVEALEPEIKSSPSWRRQSGKVDFGFFVRPSSFAAGNPSRLQPPSGQPDLPPPAGPTRGTPEDPRVQEVTTVVVNLPLSPQKVAYEVEVEGMNGTTSNRIPLFVDEGAGVSFRSGFRPE